MDADTLQMILSGTWDTVYMTVVSLILSYLLGLPLGVALVTTDKGHILENLAVNRLLGAVVNAARSVPFIILMVAVIPVTRLITGTTIGTTAAIVPLVIGAVPFVGRMVETSLKEIDWGIIEAALAMGSSPGQIICKVLLPEATSSLVLGGTITFITLVGYSAMAGFVGGGGLGDIAVRYGYYRYKMDVMGVTVVILLFMVQLIQSFGNIAAQKLNRK